MTNGERNERNVAPPPKPRDVEVSTAGVVEGVRGGFAAAGDISRFAFGIVRDLPALRFHMAEMLRQSGILILSSGLIIWLMQFVIGGQCGLEAAYTLDQIGAPLYSGIFTSWCAVREMAPYMWGYILAAKVGCGLVAEIGSMQIAEEVDALEVMGVEPLHYLIGTRVAAAWITMPFLYIIGLGVMFIAEYLVVVVQLGGVSSGGYSLIFWLFQSPTDLLFSMIKIMVMGTIVVIVGCYYGYTAKGGPVGVGINTAKSMMVNMVLIHIVGVLGTQLFWGLAPNAPIAN